MKQFAQFTGGRVGKMAAVDEGDPFKLVLHGFQDFRHTMADTHDTGTAGAIDVAFARGVPDVYAFSPVGYGINFG